MSHVLEQELDSYFVVNDGRSSFRVPKAGLSEGMLNKIRSYGRKMAEGGGVDFAGDTGVSDAGISMPQANNIPVPLTAPMMAPAFSPMPVAGVPSVPVVPVAPAQDPDLRAIENIKAQGRRGQESMALPPGVRPAGVKPPAETPTGEQPPPPKPKPGGGMKLPADTSGAEFEAAQGAERDAIAASEAATVERARAEAAALVEHGQVLKKAALDEAELRTRAKAQADQAMSRVKAAQDEMARVNTKVDPGRFMASRGTAGKIATAIGLALGAFDPSGVNRAAQLLNQFIDRDIDAQKSESDAAMRKAGAGVTAAQNLYAMQRQATGDDIAALAAAKASMYEVADLKLKEIAASARAPEAQAKALELRAILQGQRAKHTEDTHKRLFDENMRRDASAQGWAALNQRGGGGMSATDATAARNKIEAAKNIDTSLDNAMRLIQEYGTVELTGSEGDQIHKALSDYAADFSKLKDPTGSVREGDIERELGALGININNPAAVFANRDTVIKKLQSAKADVNERLINAGLRERPKAAK